MLFYYSDHFDIPLPPKHPFPGRKYSQLREVLIQRGVLSSELLRPSPQLDPKDLLHVHCPNYVEQFLTGSLPVPVMKRIGFPWSEHLVQRTLATIGGAVASAQTALELGLSGQLAGGTHHAHRDYGLGYCIFNDFAVAADHLLRTKKVDRVAIVDLDVHQGDGNASLLGHRPDVFIFSMHGEKNFPFKKFNSDLDIPLPDGCEDPEYLHHLESGMEQVLGFRPDLVLYQAGVDILKEDRLGRLNISMEGLSQRDHIVLSRCQQRGIPVSMAIGGGYADPIDHSVMAYAQTYEVAQRIHGF
jgi:acetoin utilization deacetylase AcuC-like enzyme